MTSETYILERDEKTGRFLKGQIKKPFKTLKDREDEAKIIQDKLKSVRYSRVETITFIPGEETPRGGWRRW